MKIENRQNFKTHMRNTDVDHICKVYTVLKRSKYKPTPQRLKMIQGHINQPTDIDREAARNGDFDTRFESLYAETYVIKD